MVAQGFAKAVVLVSLLSLLAPAIAIEHTGVTFAQISPKKVGVNVSYTFDKGLSASTPAVCNAQAPNSPCLTKIQAASQREGVVVNYAVLSGFAPNLTATITLKACYSPFSRVNRPWRAVNDIIKRSKACAFTIRAGLNPVSGNVTWYPNDLVPLGTYFVRAFVYPKGSNPDAIAYGDSVGFFQINGIPSKPTSMKIAAGICACLGPLLLAGFFIWEFSRKKNV